MANNTGKEIEYMMPLQSLYVFWLNQSETLAATVIYILSKDTTRRRNMNNKRIIVQANTVPSGHTAGRVVSTEGISPAVMYRNSKVIQVLVKRKTDKQHE